VVQLTPSQIRTRERVEALIKLMAPGLDMILAAGDRISRLVEPEDHDYYPARPYVEPGPVEPSAAAVAAPEPRKPS
jgi:hypothetical protein